MASGCCREFDSNQFFVFLCIIPREMETKLSVQRKHSKHMFWNSDNLYGNYYYYPEKENTIIFQNHINWTDEALVQPLYKTTVQRHDIRPVENLLFMNLLIKTHKGWVLLLLINWQIMEKCLLGNHSVTHSSFYCSHALLFPAGSMEEVEWMQLQFRNKWMLCVQEV